MAGVSRHHFVRCFTRTYGEPPMRYLSRRRTERAQDLLRSANVTVTEICLLVGYRSLGSFSSRFHELSAKGVTFLQEPADRPYGVEAVLRDNTGNWLVLVEPKAWTPADFPPT